MRKSAWESIQKILPKYAMKPLAIMFILNITIYGSIKFLVPYLTMLDFTFPIDYKIPCIPFFIVFYFLAYVQWIVGYVIIGRESKEVCDYIASGEIIAKLICMVCFIVLPTTIARPEIVGEDVFSVLTRWLYAIDSPHNLFPSIHTLESWMVFRGSLSCKKVSNLYRVVMLVGALSVFASTVFLRQHVVVDIIGGIAVGELGLFIAPKVKRLILKMKEQSLK